MTSAALRLTAAEANAALNAFGFRVKPWGNSKTKFWIFYAGDNTVMHKVEVAEMIELRQKYA